MGHVGPLGKNLTFFVSLGITEILGFSELFMLNLPCSKPFRNILNYASAANIEEVTKFYNLGDKIFETDFIYYHISSQTLMEKKLNTAKICSSRIK